MSRIYIMYYILFIFNDICASPVPHMVKNLPAMQETQVWSLDQEDSLEEDIATHCGILAWRIPLTEEPDELQSIGSQTAGHDWSNWARLHIYYLISKNGIIPVVPACKLESTLAAWPFRKNVLEPWSQRLWLFTYSHPHSNPVSYMSENWSIIYDLPS